MWLKAKQLQQCFCLMRQNKIHDFTWADQDWIGLIIFKNFADQACIGFTFVRSGLGLRQKNFTVHCGSSLLKKRNSTRLGQLRKSTGKFGRSVQDTPKLTIKKLRPARFRSTSRSVLLSDESAFTYGFINTTLSTVTFIFYYKQGFNMACSIDIHIEDLLQVTGVSASFILIALFLVVT